MARIYIKNINFIFRCIRRVFDVWEECDAVVLREGVLDVCLGILSRYSGIYHSLLLTFII